MTTKKSVWTAIEDDVTAQRLVELARAHFRLALEHIGKACPERRQAIQAEIECLRAERELLLTSFEQGGRKMSEDFEKYEQLVCREDELCFELKTYQEIISELLMLVHKRGTSVLNLETVEEVMTTLYMAEIDCRTELLDTQLEKSILSYNLGRES
ncbi:hypothetical protein BBD42_21515 [Paenibacillus sp. BIHB 4019]|uniref:Uncharacterized protein n=1 Tax=Paenibacillus sp. BIHB 4019 TaxID=1870819 RepID=A0A1B2DM26_9BACL|nr:hypothetical protein [Paenibacillus sp. BIHB 4019]ANY68755.1 hypothetical protein BBD42_21515 [Paenibacillus sp. BIHB 4019]